SRCCSRGLWNPCLGRCRTQCLAQYRLPEAIRISVTAPHSDRPFFDRCNRPRDSSRQLKPAGRKCQFPRPADGTVLPELAKREPDRLKPDILAIMQLGQQDECLRLVSSAIVSSLQLGIENIASAFKSIVPSVLERFQDPNVRVRRNSVSLIANLMPDIPETAIQPFI